MMTTNFTAELMATETAAYTDEVTRAAERGLRRDIELALPWEAPMAVADELAHEIMVSLRPLQVLNNPDEYRRRLLDASDYVAAAALYAVANATSYDCVSASEWDQRDRRAYVVKIGDAYYVGRQHKTADGTIRRDGDSYRTTDRKLALRYYFGVATAHLDFPTATQEV
jgi:hypothetical protein